ncbi:ABC transporter permease [Achromobacter marplatensis]|uniref:hypothetical protein n=1 Tax=Achromobacter marplatensis TaxID=470868 RepID=UPI0039F67A55
MSAFGPSRRRRKALAPWLAAAALLVAWQLASLLGWPLLRVDLPGAVVALLLGAGLGGWRGVRAADPKLIEMGRSVGLAGWPLWRDVFLPGALPASLSGARLALALFWTWRGMAQTAIVRSGDGAATLAPIFSYVLLALAADTLIRMLARRALPWNAAAYS